LAGPALVRAPAGRRVHARSLAGVTRAPQRARALYGGDCVQRAMTTRPRRVPLGSRAT
jgi:hypothetical protein